MVDRWIADSSLSARYPIYTRANVGEVFPDPVTPLTFDCGIHEAEWGWRDAWVRIGAFDADEFDPNELEQLGITGGYCYLNASIVRLFGERAPGLSWQAMDEQFFGVMPGIPPYEEQAGDIRPDLTEKIGAVFLWALSVQSLADLPELADDQRITKDLRAARPDLASLTNAELVERYEALMGGHFRSLFAHHIFASYMATLPVGILTAVCAGIGQSAALLDLVAGVGDVDSAAPSFALWDLGRVVAESPELTAVFETGTGGLLERIRGLDGAAAEKFLVGFDDFVVEFGCRGPNEWEARSPTWETRPELALAAVDRMRLSPAGAAPTLQQAARAEARAGLGAALTEALAVDPAVQGQFQAALHAATVWLPARERTKTNAIRLIHEARMAMRELGRRLAEEGSFDEAEDFGFLRQSELATVVADPASLTEELRRRRAAYQQLGTLEPPFVFVGEPAPLSTWPGRSDHSDAGLGAGDELAGLPGCPGVVEGTARVVLDASDPTALQPGDVLVAPITDPSWTPLFVPASAVVVDVGAMLSHAVIVSRELGIPCVVSATGATQRIPDGARVRVDGGTGLITILAVPA